MKKFLLSIFAVLFAFAGVQAQSYVKVTSAPADWSGDYLIVYEDGNVAFNGGLSKLDATSNTISVTISNGKINADATTNAAKFTIAKSGDSYIIKNVGGYYIGATSNANTLLASFSEMTNTISWEDGSPKIVAQRGAVLRYNATSGQTRFRYFKSGTYTAQKAIALYKYTEGEVVPTAPGLPELTKSQEFKGSMTVTITSDATVYYTTDGTTPSKTNGTEYTAPFEITATTTVKAVAVNEVGESDVAEATYTLFVVEETEGYYIKVASEPADWSGKYLVVYEEAADAYVFNGKDEANGYVLAETDGDIIAANGEIDAVAVTIAAMDGGYSVKTANGYIYGTSGSNALKFNSTTEQVNSIEYVDGEGVQIVSNTSVLRFNSASNGMRFRYYKAETYNQQEPVQLYKYVTELPSYQLSVTDAGYATLFLDFNAAIPTNVEAYIIKKDGINNGYITLTQVTGVLPAKTGIIVKANAGDYTFAYSADEAADVAGNLLEGSVTDKYVEGEAYVLGVVDGAVGLYNALASGTSWLNNANKAYLPASEVPASVQGAASFSFRFGEGTTAIENVEVENEVKAIYDLTGRKVETISAPGIYIVNGVKRVVR